jgi:RHS repeat-associated protein
MNVAVNLLGTAGTTPYSQINWTHKIGQRTYELSNHLGNVLSVISDKVIPHPSGSTVAYYKADILQSQDYSPFGVTLKGRNLKKTGLADEFRFGFNGMETDDEMKGDGNSYDFGNRMYDTRLGRFLSIDKYASKFSFQSPYLISGNSPLKYIDLKGDSLTIASTIYASTMKGLTVLSRTTAGKEILKFYMNSSTEHIFIYGFDDAKGSNNSSIAETNSSEHVKIAKDGTVELLQKNSQQNQSYINSTLNKATIARRAKSGKVNFIGRNFTDDKNLRFDEYDLAMVMYHEMNAHIKNRTGSPDKDHKKFGSDCHMAGMKLWYSDPFNPDGSNKSMVVQYGTDSWVAFRDILSLKIADGK